MTTYSFFRLADGVFTGTVAQIPEQALKAHLRGNLGAMPGRYDCTRQKVDLATMQVIPWTAPRPADTDDVRHELDAALGWVAIPTDAALWRGVRAERNQRLAETDWVVSRALEAGESVPAEWVAYRQALRDVTKQPDPEAIDWPEAP